MNTENIAEFISIIVPTYNEESYVAAAIEQLKLDDGNYEIIVVDGMSTDRTKEIVLKLAASDDKVRFLENPKRIQGAAVNIGAAQADPRAKAFVQADAHCGYPKNFCRNVVSAMRENGATSGVVPMLTAGNETPFQEAVAIAQNSKLGNGGSAHRISNTASGFVDHGHHAAFDRDFFLSAGGYNDDFPINHDGEYDTRTAKAGAKVWMDADSQIIYFPRKTFQALVKQYFRYGLGRANTIITHNARPKLRQLAPVGITLAVVGGAFLGLFNSFFFVFPAVYAKAVVGYSLFLSSKSDDVRDRKVLLKKAGLVSSAFAAMHLSWGAGFITKAASVVSQKFVSKLTSKA